MQGTPFLRHCFLPVFPFPRRFYMCCVGETVKGLPRDVFIDGYMHRNRAFHGDIVVVRLINESQTKREQHRIAFATVV